MADVGGFFNRQVIRDTRGTTNNSVGGVGNTTSFVGDSGRNSFDIGGAWNNTDVNNLGRDDRVNLQGPGWQELRDGNDRDGTLRYYNSLSGSYAEVKTDGGRNDEFVRRRVSGANNSAQFGSWNDIGNAASYGYQNGFQNGYLAGLQAGQSQRYNQGYSQRRNDSGFDVGNWLNRMILGPMAWGL